MDGAGAEELVGADLILDRVEMLRVGGLRL